MRPLYIKLENINSFREEQTVDFEALTSGEKIFCISGDTGSGKSTIFSAILLALYHKPKGGKIEEFINLSAEKGKIEFSFEEKGVRYVVKRVIAKNSNANRISLSADGEIIASGDEVYAKILEIIGLECDQFTQIALLEQGKFGRFLEHKPAERSKTLSKILSLERLSGLYSVANKKLNSVNNDINSFNSRLSQMEKDGLTKERLKELKSGIKPLKLNVEKLKKERDELSALLSSEENKRKLHEEIKRLTVSLTEAKNKALSAERQLNDLRALSADPDKELAETIQKEESLKAVRSVAVQLKKDINSKTVELTSSRQKYTELKSKRDALADELAKSLNSDVDNAVALILSVKKEGDECPVCGGRITASEKTGGGAIDRADKERKLATLDADIANIVKDGKRIASETEALKKRFDVEVNPYGDVDVNLAQATDRRKALEKIKSDFAKAQTEHAENKSRLDTLKAELDGKGKDSYDEAQGALLSEKSKAVSNELENALKKLSADEREIERITESLKDREVYEKTLKDLAVKQKNLTKLVTIFYGDGFSKFVAEEYIKDFTVSASEIMNKLSGGNYTLVYDDYDFKIRDFLNENKERKVKTLSGGETFLAALSIAVSIIRYISAGKSLEFFFLDEGFGTLHEEAVETVVSALRELSKDVTVGVISHVDDLVDRIPSRIRIVHANDDHGSLVE
ncbi:MAG: SMC family ATPase [Clostridia bacterium]|nr:SMC family ATPase [Clostridia bacterium]